MIDFNIRKTSVLALTTALLYVFSILVTGSMAIAASLDNDAHTNRSYITDSTNIDCHADTPSIQVMELFDALVCQDSPDAEDCSFCAQAQFSVPARMQLFTLGPRTLTGHGTPRLTSLERTLVHRPPK
ncbi:MAG: hypothetical protein BMS9Abin26_1436 [Gammaproteobacteria bacterium]|nr:MAG: hypothetical protein BMS9Abin26_1436 [Gammaproteobacteria bacterium]